MFNFLKLALTLTCVEYHKVGQFGDISQRHGYIPHLLLNYFLVIFEGFSLKISCISWDKRHKQ
jgi:hypothetical protein